MPFFSNGFGSRPSVVSSTVLCPVSGSAGFKSSVFLSSCAKAAPDHAPSRTRANNSRRMRATRWNAPMLQLLRKRTTWNPIGSGYPVTFIRGSADHPLQCRPREGGDPYAMLLVSRQDVATSSCNRGHGGYGSPPEPVTGPAIAGPIGGDDTVLVARATSLHGGVDQTPHHR